MDDKKISTNIYITKELKTNLKKYCADHDTNLTILGNQLFEQFLATGNVPVQETITPAPVREFVFYGKNLTQDQISRIKAILDE